MIGLLGGTFNPVHWGHVRLAQHVRETFGLERVELIPCAVPPHKPSLGLLPFDVRVALLKSAVSKADAPHILDVNTLEARLPGPSYTWNLVHAWRAERGAVPLFILGDEDFAGLDLWHRGLELPGCTDLLIIGRANGAEGALFRSTVARFWPHAEVSPRPETAAGALGASLAPERQCWFIPVPKVDVSSSQLRERWRHGDSVRELTPVWQELEQLRDLLESCWREDEARGVKP